MRKLICHSGRFAGREIELQGGVQRVGRNLDNDIQIEESSVSGFHCELEIAEIGVAVRDLNSTNGTFINHARIAKGILQTGDWLTLGDVEFRIQLPDVRVALPEVPVFEPAGAAFLDDGTPGCFHHRESPALFRCSRCENWWCGECVRSMKRLSGDFLLFCPECSGACEAIPTGTVERKSFFARLTDTLRLPRKR